MKIESSPSDMARSHVYLDTQAAIRAQRSEDFLLAYERNRDRLETFHVETSLCEILHRCPMMFTQPGARQIGWASMSAGASTK